MKYEIRNRWSRAVQFTAEIECEANTSEEIKLGLAVRAAVNASADLRDADLRYANLVDADLKKANLRGADLHYANLMGVNLKKANLRGADLSSAYLVDANLKKANLRGADLLLADLRGAILEDADLSGAYLERANLSGANLVRAFLADAYFEKADLSDADLSDADLAAADLAAANLVGAKIHDGITITRAPICIRGLAWNVVIYNQHMQIGCEFHSHDEWRGFSREDWLRMGGKEGVRLLERHFPALDFLCAVHAKACQTDAAKAEATAS